VLDLESIYPQLPLIANFKPPERDQAIEDMKWYLTTGAQQAKGAGGLLLPTAGLVLEDKRVKYKRYSMASSYRYIIITAALLLSLQQYLWLYTSHQSFEGSDNNAELLKSGKGASIERSSTSNSSNSTISSSSKVKIVAFTSFDYLPVALWWYDRMTNLSYTSHTLVLIDNEAVEYFEALNSSPVKLFDLTSNEDNSEHQNQKPEIEEKQYRTETMIVDPGTRRKNKIRALWYSRIFYCLEEVKAGRNLLLTDIDNVFSRYVDINKEFLLSPVQYDAIFSFEVKFPGYVYDAQGFVVCGGMTFLRATPQTVAVLEKLLVQCVGGEANRCDDQVEWNILLYNDMKWNTPVKKKQRKIFVAKKESSHSKSFSGDELMQLGFNGRSKTIPEFHAKIWDRDFAWRGEFHTPVCPGIENWVAMPMNVPYKYERQIKARSKHTHGYNKLARIIFWEAFCGLEGTNRDQTKPVNVTIQEAFERIKGHPMITIK